MPPRAVHAAICSSSMLRGLGTSRLGLEWLKITGWLLCSMISSVARLPTCVQSSTSPRRLHSSTTRRPNRVRPMSVRSSSPSQIWLVRL